MISDLRLARVTFRNIGMLFGGTKTAGLTKDPLFIRAAFGPLERPTQTLLDFLKAAQPKATDAGLRDIVAKSVAKFDFLAGSAADDLPELAEALFDVIARLTQDSYRDVYLESVEVGADSGINYAQVVITEECRPKLIPIGPSGDIANGQRMTPGAKLVSTHGTDCPDHPANQLAKTKAGGTKVEPTRPVPTPPKPPARAEMTSGSGGGVATVAANGIGAAVETPMIDALGRRIGIRLAGVDKSVNDGITLEKALLALIVERTYQTKKWGTLEQHPHSQVEWLTIAGRLIDKAKDLWMQSGSSPQLTEAIQAEMVQAAAVLVAGLQQSGAPLRKFPLPS